MYLYKGIKNCFISLILTLCVLNPVQLYGQNTDSIPNNTKDSQQKSIDSTLSIDDTATADSIQQTKQDTMISGSALEEVVEYKAKDSVQFNLQSNKANLFNKGKVNYKAIELKSGKITMDWETNNMHARGISDTAGNVDQAPVFKEGQQKFEADSMDYNFKSKKGKLYGLKTEKAQGYLHGEEVKKDENDVTFASKAKYTTCDKDDPHFHIEANKIKAIPNDKIISGPANLVIDDVPTPLYLPFGFFPNSQSQSSGILLPSYGEDGERGFYLKGLGYYFGISDKMDLTVSGNIFSKGSWRARTITRYKKRYQNEGRLQLEFGIDKFGEESDPNYREQQAFIIEWEHNQARKAQPFSNFSGNVQIASNQAYNNQQENITSRKKNQLNSRVNYSHQLPGTPFNAQLNASHSQKLSDNTFNLTLPQATFNMRRVSPFQTSDIGFVKNSGINYQANFQNRLQTTDTSLFNRNTWQNFQKGIQHTASYSTSAKVLKYFSLNPSFNYRESFFFEQEQRTYNPEKDTLLKSQKAGFYNVRTYDYSASISTNIYGTYNINNFGIFAARHVLNPRINISYSPDFTAPRFNNIFSYQTDEGEQKNYFPYKGPYSRRPGTEQGSMGISLNNNLEMKVRNTDDSTEDTKKISLLDNFNIRGNYNFLADSFPLSNISFDANTRILNNISIQLRGSIDPYYLDPSDSTRVEKLSLEENGKIGRVTNFSLNVRTSLNPRTFNNENDQKPHQTRGYRSLASLHYVDFDLPWNLSLTYNLNYGRRNFQGQITGQNIRVNGNVSLTDKWKISGNTSYNMQEGEFAPSQVSINRDLHCWKMSFRWQPFTDRAFYMFRITAKSSVLKDLEYEKKRRNF